MAAGCSDRLWTLTELVERLADRGRRVVQDQPARPVWAYERTLKFAIPISRAWSLFVDPAETAAWLLPFEEKPGGHSETTIEGQPTVKLAVEKFDAPNLLVTRMSGGNIPGSTVMTTRFAQTPDGSRVTVSHHGFGDPVRWEVFGTSFRRGWDEAICDLVVYVRTGVKMARHIDDRRASIAAWPLRRVWGIELAEVFPGGFADQAGMKQGDILLKLDRATIYDVADIWTFTRARPAGDEVEATFIRGRDVKTGRGHLSRFEDFGE
jgi:uncharacterized protein YndB with AHSA1/START domain